jgi:hypothetical protein
MIQLSSTKTDCNIRELDLFTHYYMKMETGYLGK